MRDEPVETAVRKFHLEVSRRDPTASTCHDLRDARGAMEPLPDR